MLSSSKPIRVCVVDDQRVVRTLLRKIFEAAPDIEVVGEASDPFEARAVIKETSPDVITLDVEMPKMDGLTFLRNLMRLRPTPVIMVSSLTGKGADVTVEALSIGAVDYVQKPTQGSFDVQRAGDELVAKVRAAAQTKRGALGVRHGAAKALPTKVSRARLAKLDVIAIGASTGGVEALRDIMTALPAGLPPIVVTQHILQGFAEQFATRINQLSKLHTVQATHRAVLQPGGVYIAPSGHHLQIKRGATGYQCYVQEGKRVAGHLPSVDVMFESVASSVKDRALGVLLTGMGADGAQGLLKMKNAGAVTAAQDQTTSVIWGMPKAAIDLGATDLVLSLPQVISLISAVKPNKTQVRTG